MRAQMDPKDREAMVADLVALRSEGSQLIHALRK